MLCWWHHHPALHNRDTESTPTALHIEGASSPIGRLRLGPAAVGSVCGGTAKSRRNCYTDPEWRNAARSQRIPPRSQSYPASGK